MNLPLKDQPLEAMTDTQRLRVLLAKVQQARRVLLHAKEKQMTLDSAARSAFDILNEICSQIPRIRREPRQKRKKGTNRGNKKVKID